ncbi:MAG: hypothetical protein QM783_04265 [Phycisphaerales bacterium]
MRISNRVLAAAAACCSVAMIGHTAYADMTYNSAVTIGVEPASVWVSWNTIAPFTVTANAGTLINGTFNIFNNATVNMSGGRVTNSVTTDNNSRFNLTGGTITQGVVAEHSSSFFFSGGVIGDGTSQTTLRNTARFDMTGGTFAGLLFVVDGNSLFNLAGGTFSVPITLQGSGTINLYGTNLRILATSVQTNQTIFTLAGTLADGTVLNNLRITRPTAAASTASFHLLAVPTPGSAALAGVGVVAAFGRRRG